MWDAHGSIYSFGREGRLPRKLPLQGRVIGEHTEIGKYLQYEFRIGIKNSLKN